MKNRAFTLIELLVVIVIIGILASITTTTFENQIQKSKTAKGLVFWQQINSQMSEHVEDMYLRLNFEEGSGTSSSDSSGKGNTFTVGNANLWSTDTPHANSDYSLATRFGSTSYTSYIAQADVPKLDFTASFWLKINNHTDYNDIMYYYWRNTPAHGWHISIGGDNFGGALHYSVGNYTDRARVSAPNLETDRWYHVLITRDTERNTISMYLDGEFIGSDTQEPGTQFQEFDANERLEIGAVPNYLGATIPNGDDFLVDDVVFWGQPYREEE